MLADLLGCKRTPQALTFRSVTPSTVPCKTTTTISDVASYIDHISVHYYYLTVLAAESIASCRMCDIYRRFQTLLAADAGTTRLLFRSCTTRPGINIHFSLSTRKVQHMSIWRSIKSSDHFVLAVDSLPFVNGVVGSERGFHMTRPRKHEWLDSESACRRNVSSSVQGKSWLGSVTRPGY